VFCQSSEVTSQLDFDIRVVDGSHFNAPLERGDGDRFRSFQKTRGGGDESLVATVSSGERLNRSHWGEPLYFAGGLMEPDAVKEFP
jgi:hypothetical protein